MDKRRVFTILTVGLILMACAEPLMAQSTLDTALTYEGFLKSNNRPVNRTMDLRFTLFADPNATQPIGSTIEAIGVDVIDGHFALELDFGAAPFTGEPRWLQTELRRNDRPDDPYIPQTPLLRLTLSPYAIFAGRAGYVQDGITGRGTAGSIPRFTDPNTIGDSVIFENAGNVGIGTQTPNEKLSVDGIIETTAGGVKFPDGSVQTTAVVGGSGIPTGGIIMWSGSIATIPTGWALCDGGNGTPDLKDRFVVGATQDDGGQAKTTIKGSLMQTGGEHQHTLTIAEIPKHHHSYQHHPTWRFSGDSEWGGKGNISNYNTGDTGGDQPHENCPPFFALAFIMKL